MGQKYSSQSSTGYNSSPPADDGSTTAANKITWATIKTKLSDALKTFIEAVNSQLVTALDFSATSTSSPYTTAASDHDKLIEVTGATTISLGDATTMGSGYRPGVCNKGVAVVTVALVTAANTLNGNANGTVKLLPGQSMWFLVNQAVTGYDIDKASNREPIILTGAAGTNTVTAACDATFTAWSANQIFLLNPANTNTGATTLNPTPAGGSALGAKNIFSDGAACIGGELKASVPVLLQYDGTQLHILGRRSFKQPTIQVFTSGSGTYTTPASVTRIEVEIVGAGAGGAGSGTAPGAAGDGGSSTFSTVTAGGGTKASAATGGAGGTATGGDINLSGQTGRTASTGATNQPGGDGGSTRLGSGGFGGNFSSNTAGAAPAANTGAGGGGAGNSSVASPGGGGGGAAWAFKVITSPAATYSYAVGAAGTAGTAGGTGDNAAAGAAGIIIAREFYN